MINQQDKMVYFTKSGRINFSELKEKFELEPYQFVYGISETNQGPSLNQIEVLFQEVSEKENIPKEQLRLFSDCGSYSVYALME